MKGPGKTMMAERVRGLRHRGPMGHGGGFHDHMVPISWNDHDVIHDADEGPGFAIRRAFASSGPQSSGSAQSYT